MEQIVAMLNGQIQRLRTMVINLEAEIAKLKEENEKLKAKKKPKK